MKQLISTIENDENSNKYYYNKMLSDLETESRHEDILRKQKKKWRSESLKYMEKVHLMKEKKEDMYHTKMNNLQKEINLKEKEISERLAQNRKQKEAERKKALEIFLKKEKSAKEAYNKKLKKDEKEREENEKRILSKCKYKNFILNIFIYYLFSGNFQRKKSKDAKKKA